MGLQDCGAQTYSLSGGFANRSQSAGFGGLQFVPTSQPQVRSDFGSKGAVVSAALALEVGTAQVRMLPEIYEVKVIVFPDSVIVAGFKVTYIKAQLA